MPALLPGRDLPQGPGSKAQRDPRIKDEDPQRDQVGLQGRMEEDNMPPASPGVMGSAAALWELKPCSVIAVKHSVRARLVAVGCRRQPTPQTQLHAPGQPSRKLRGCFRAWSGDSPSSTKEQPPSERRQEVQGPKIKDVQCAALQHQFPFPADTCQLASIPLFPTDLATGPQEEELQLAMMSYWQDLPPCPGLLEGQEGGWSWW